MRDINSENEHEFNMKHDDVYRYCLSSVCGISEFLVTKYKIDRTESLKISATLVQSMTQQYTANEIKDKNGFNLTFHTDYENPIMCISESLSQIAESIGELSKKIEQHD